MAAKLRDLEKAVEQSTRRSVRVTAVRSASLPSLRSHDTSRVCQFFSI
jgi:hypothetical protein